ncbi:hypothetical protein LTR36_000065 [Oleoguttula mirabilis]|uniref:Uncharacterized protein n=1 Tax=Oleoguttula mirabilis TaxID=1507867 RepID=A0AAV9JXI5_9PEZI|nr:hypothetical protein LTR36_000065 [Oleoguttula mirabilis]
MTTDMGVLRQQIMANARLLIKPTGPSTATNLGDLDVVVFGYSSSFTAAVMLGLTPAVEGTEEKSPELAMNKLFLATCELLKLYLRKCCRTSATSMVAECLTTS